MTVIAVYLLLKLSMQIIILNLGQIRKMKLTKEILVLVYLILWNQIIYF